MTPDREQLLDDLETMRTIDGLRGQYAPDSVLIYKEELEAAQRLAAYARRVIDPPDDVREKIIATASGNDAESFDWSFLHEMDELEQENAKLKDRIAHLERETDSLGRVLYETDRIMEHFTDDKLLAGTGQWRQRELYEHCKRIHDAMESAKGVILEDFDAMNERAES